MVESKVSANNKDSTMTIPTPNFPSTVVIDTSKILPPPNPSTASVENSDDQDATDIIDNKDANNPHDMASKASSTYLNSKNLSTHSDTI